MQNCSHTAIRSSVDIQIFHGKVFVVYICNSILSNVGVFYAANKNHIIKILQQQTLSIEVFLIAHD